jgi:integrase
MVVPKATPAGPSTAIPAGPSAPVAPAAPCTANSAPQPPHRTEPQQRGPRAKKISDQKEAALSVPATGLRADHLNEPGSRLQGCGCPRTWFLYPDKPPHVSLLAWQAMSEESRKQHRRWIGELRAMPDDLTKMRIAPAALELVRRMARARHWRWSTISRALSAITSALMHLPMYTNAHHGINLDDDPEWRDAKKSAARFEKETPADPPPPIPREGVLESRKHLQKNPMAELFLAMLWAFAARAGDIAGLNHEDVKITLPAPGTLAQVALTIRRGKGAKRSGPYVAASTMEATDARELHRLVQQTNTGERIFKATTTLRAAVRTALKHWHPRAALPSLRSGAARHLATSGMPEADLARLLGHRSIDTLRRYLGYADNLTAEARRTQAGTARLHTAARKHHESGGPPTTSAEGTEAASGHAHLRNRTN